MIDTYNLEKFISAYSDENAASIEFAWNDEHDEFEDSNVTFRKAVMKAVLSDPEKASVTLIRDLFRAETQYAAELWAVDFGVEDLGILLLRRGGPAYVEDFLEGRYQSFDTMCCATPPHDEALAREMLAEIERRLANSPEESRRELLEAGKEDFGFILKPATKFARTNRESEK